MTDLLKCRVEEILHCDPWNDDTHDVRWIAQQGGRYAAVHESDHDPPELVYAGYRGAWVVDRRGDCLQGDVDDLDNPEFDVLLQRACRPDVERRTKLRDSLLIEALPRRGVEQRDTLRNEMPDAAEQANPHLEFLRQAEQALGIDIPDVARGRAADRSLPLAVIERHACRVVSVPSAVRHDVIDHAFSFACDPIDNVIDADRLRDVVNKEDQPGDAGDCEQHGAGRCGNWRERLRQGSRRRQCGHTISESTQKDP